MPSNKKAKCVFGFCNKTWSHQDACSSAFSRHGSRCYLPKNFPYLNSWVQNVGKFILIAQLFKNVLLKDFSGGIVDKNPLVFRFNPGTRVQPWLGKIPSTSEQLTPCAATTEAPGPRACALQQEKPWQWEGCVLQLERSPPPQLSASRESPCAAAKTQSNQR